MRASVGAAQPQQPPPQHPPPPPADIVAPVARAADADIDDFAPAPVRPLSATVERSFTVSVCPSGQPAASPAALMGRSTSNVAAHSRHRNS